LVGFSIVKKSEKELARRPDLAILDIIDAGYYEVDLSGRFTFVSKALGRLFGLPPGKLIGLENRSFMSPESAREIFRIFNEVYRTGKSRQSGETEVRLKDGPAHIVELTVSLRRGPDETPVGFRGIVHDITERKRIESALAESEERFRTLYENSTVGLYRTTPEGRVLLANPALLRMLGYDSFEELAVVDLRSGGLGPEYPRPAFFEHLRKVVVVQGLEATWKKKDGSTIYVRESARAVFDSEGRVKYCEGTVEDITDRKRAELKLQASEKKYHRIFDHSLEGIFQTTAEGWMISANRAMIRMFGYKKLPEFLAANIFDHLDDGGLRTKILETLKAEDEIRNWELTLRRKDGSVFHALLNATVLLDANGRIDHIEGMLADITDLVQSKAALQAVLREKDSLMKEIHHRVKNNMQIISSLLGFQSRFIKDPDAIRIFENSQDRIRTMAMIHESLYRFESRSRIDFAKYARSMIDSLFAPEMVSSGRVKFHLDVDSLDFDVKTSLSLGLIINELISNALKYGFPEDRGGKIEIGLRQQADGEILLIVRDDGIGLPPKVKIGESESMGLQVVEILTDQLEGRIELGPPPGTEFRITFRAPAA
jgi:PAS domain S-box-containing protein